MLRWINKLDRLLSFSSPSWLWLGQWATVLLGIHLAADRLDDHLLEALLQVPFGWPSPEFPLAAATWFAVAVELMVGAWALWTIGITRNEPAKNFAVWRARLSVRSVVAPLFWAPVAAAGSWVVAMSIEDATSQVLLEAAQPLGGLVAAVVGLRLGGSAFVRMVRQMPEPKNRLEGLWATPFVLLVAGLAAFHGLPIRGMLP